MSELDDFDFASSRETLKGAPSPGPGGGGRWIVAGILTGVLLGAAGLFVFRRRAPAPPPSTLSAPTTLATAAPSPTRSEEHTSELQSRSDLVCRLLLEKKKKMTPSTDTIAKIMRMHS